MISIQLITSGKLCLEVANNSSSSKSKSKIFILNLIIKLKKGHNIIKLLFL
jgi:hypothetical protein